MINFDEEFAGIFDYARMYREIGLQVVPSVYPSKGTLNWKRPALNNWREYQNDLVDDNQFQIFFHGHNPNKINIGILTGACSGRVFVVDLDTHKNPDASIWWDCCLDMQQKAGELETPTQKTGGGGIQMLFRAPEGWSPPTIKTSVGVDIRGVGGFAVIAPSMHESGTRYRWEEGLEPWNMDVADAPEWFCSQIDELAERHGGHVPSSAGGVRTEAPAHQVTPWGKVVDGREDLMTRIVFRAVLFLYRDCPIIPAPKESAAAMEEAFQAYLDAVESRLGGPGSSKADMLEREGRGRTLFAQKWRAAFRQWDGKISEEAARPFVKEAPERINPFAEPPPKPARPEPEEAKEEISEPKEESSGSDSEFAPKEKKLLKLYTIEEIEAFGPVKAIIENMIAEGSLGFIYGKPGGGKTFVGLSLAMSIAYGLEKWFEGRRIERHGPVIYISLEGKSDLGNRLKAFRQYHGIAHYDQRFRAVIDEVNFLSNESVKFFVDSIDDYVSAYEPPAMIFIDTVSRAIAGGRENDQDEISLFIQTCDRIRSRYKTNVCGIGHTGRSGDHMRGSSVFDGNSDYMFRVERLEGMEGVIHAEKIKAFPDKWEMPFRLEKIDLDAFGAQSSLVATTVGKSASEAFADARDKDFGGAQETGFLTIGKKLPDHVWKAIFDEAEDEWNQGTPWAESKSAHSRYAGTRIWNIVTQQIPGIKFSDSDAELVLKNLTGRLYMKSIDYIHNRKVKVGLKVINRPKV